MFFQTLYSTCVTRESLYFILAIVNHLNIIVLRLVITFYVKSLKVNLGLEQARAAAAVILLYITMELIRQCHAAFLFNIHVVTLNSLKQV